MKKATREDTKLHNSRLVLKRIYGEDDISRADLARVTGLTKTTVSALVAGLMDEGLVWEVGAGPSVGGKPPRLLRLAENARYMLCLDLSASYFRGALVNLRGEIGERVDVAVDGRRGEAVLALVDEVIQELQGESDAPILGIGIGTPGLVDTEQGVIEEAVNLGWRDVPLKGVLEGRYGRPVFVGNDSHLAALASYSFDRQGGENLILIKAGRGIGAGIVLGGQLHYGDGAGAGEIGHIVVEEGGALCSCGNRGCLETVASIRGILQKAGGLTWEEVVEAGRKGDGEIGGILGEAGRQMGAAVAYLVGSLNIRRVVIGGQMTRAGEPFLAGVRGAVRGRVLPAIAAGVEIGYTTLGDDMVLMGASALVLKECLGVI